MSPDFLTPLQSCDAGALHFYPYMDDRRRLYHTYRCFNPDPYASPILKLFCSFPSFALLGLLVTVHSNLFVRPLHNVFPVSDIFNIFRFLIPDRARAHFSSYCYAHFVFTLHSSRHLSEGDNCTLCFNAAAVNPLHHFRVWASLIRFCRLLYNIAPDYRSYVVL